MIGNCGGYAALLKKKGGQPQQKVVKVEQQASQKPKTTKSQSLKDTNRGQPAPATRKEAAKNDQPQQKKAAEKVPEKEMTHRDYKEQRTHDRHVTRGAPHGQGHKVDAVKEAMDAEKPDRERKEDKKAEDKPEAPAKRTFAEYQKQKEEERKADLPQKQVKERKVDEKAYKKFNELVKDEDMTFMKMEKEKPKAEEKPKPKQQQQQQQKKGKGKEVAPKPAPKKEKVKYQNMTAELANFRPIPRRTRQERQGYQGGKPQDAPAGEQPQQQPQQTEEETPQQEQTAEETPAAEQQ